MECWKPWPCPSRPSCLSGCDRPWPCPTAEAVYSPEEIAAVLAGETQPGTPSPENPVQAGTGTCDLCGQTVALTDIGDREGHMAPHPDPAKPGTLCAGSLEMPSTTREAAWAELRAMHPYPGDQGEEA